MKIPPQKLYKKSINLIQITTQNRDKPSNFWVWNRYMPIIQGYLLLKGGAVISAFNYDLSFVLQCSFMKEGVENLYHAFRPMII